MAGEREWPRCRQDLCQRPGSARRSSRLRGRIRHSDDSPDLGGPRNIRQSIGEGRVETTMFGAAPPQSQAPYGAATDNATLQGGAGNTSSGGTPHTPSSPFTFATLADYPSLEGAADRGPVSIAGAQEQAGTAFITLPDHTQITFHDIVQMVHPPPRCSHE